MSLLLGALGPLGCIGSSDRPKTGQLVCIQGEDRQRTLEAALTVLGTMHFSIDKADPKTGEIRTHPLPGGQAFEFWRSDNTTLRDHVTANLHSLRRTVWISIQAQVGPGVSVDCQVKVQRLNVPSEAVSSSATAFRTLTEGTIHGQSLKFSPEQQKAMEWTDIGNDPALAERIIKRIEARLKRQRRALSEQRSEQLDAQR